MKAVVLSTHDMRVDVISDSIVICEEKLHVGSVSNSIVIGLGNTLVDEVDNSILITKQLDRCSIGTNSIISTSSDFWDSKQVLGYRRPNLILRTEERRPLDFVEWFDLVDLGLETTSYREMIVVRNVTSGSIFKKSGLEPGDQIRAIDHVGVYHLDDVRRLLRKAFTHGSCSLTIHRGVTTVNLKCHFLSDDRFLDR